VATFAELVRETALDDAQVAHLQRLVSSWGLLSDLCFADLQLFVPSLQAPESASRAAGSGPPAGGLRFVVLGQIRPTTSQTLYLDDEVGRTFDASQRELVARAWELGQIIDGESRVAGRREIASVQCIPVRWKDTLLGIVTRESAPWVGRRRGELERVYVEVFDRFARMIAAGEFPFGAEETEPDEAPRVGDGVARLDAAGRIDFASPNFVSALHRMGIHANTQGVRLGELGIDESPVRTAFAIGLPFTEEIERDEVVVLVRCIPFLDRGRASGAVVVMRDVSDLRRRDRLLISKDATIREIHHRVKNNLQTISSLLRLQGRRLESVEARAAIEESVRRIRSIALVHDTLATGAGEEVEFGQIIRPLVRMVEEGLLSDDRPIRLGVDGDAGELRAEVATPLAVVLTELLQNAVQHAFPGEDGGGRSSVGQVVVSLDNDGTTLLVTVHDNGVGFPAGFDLRTLDGSSLGLTIVRTLVVSELNGTIDILNDDGAVVALRVPVGPGVPAGATSGTG